MQSNIGPRNHYGPVTLENPASASVITIIGEEIEGGPTDQQYTLHLLVRPSARWNGVTGGEGVEAVGSIPAGWWVRKLC